MRKSHAAAALKEEILDVTIFAFDSIGRRHVKVNEAPDQVMGPVSPFLHELCNIGLQCLHLLKLLSG